jgi:hypothetical protein
VRTTVPSQNCAIATLKLKNFLSRLSSYNSPLINISH